MHFFRMAPTVELGASAERWPILSDHNAHAVDGYSRTSVGLPLQHLRHSARTAKGRHDLEQRRWKAEGGGKESQVFVGRSHHQGFVGHLKALTCPLGFGLQCLTSTLAATPAGFLEMAASVAASVALAVSTRTVATQ